MAVENPANSLYWKTSAARKFLEPIDGFFTDFHNCCHGGTRDKLTRFWSNRTWLSPLQTFCDGSHTHESWRPRVQDGKLLFPTAEEAAYPWLLCTRIANLMIDAGLRMGAVQPTTLLQQSQQQEFSLLNRYIFGALPRTTKLRPLVNEFAMFQHIVAAFSTQDLADGILQLLLQAPKSCPDSSINGEFYGRDSCLMAAVSLGSRKVRLKTVTQWSVTKLALLSNPCSLCNKP